MWLLWEWLRFFSNFVSVYVLITNQSLYKLIENGVFKFPLVVKLFHSQIIFFKIIVQENLIFSKENVQTLD